jgi:hypothetical protein
MALETSSPARPTYIGFLLIELAPVVTKAEALAGSSGSSVVLLRRNSRTVEPASPTEAAAIAPAAARRPADGGWAPLVSAR